MNVTVFIVIFLALFGDSYGYRPYRKVRPMRRREYETQAVEELTTVLETMGEVDCALECLEVEICHLYRYKNFQCRMLTSVCGIPNLDPAETVYKKFWTRRMVKQFHILN